MKVSIIMPVYNAENHIRSCLTSILSQSYNNLEVIVIDDGSTDNSRELIKRIKEIDRRVIYYYQKNSGPSSARNLGISKCTGDYVTFVDADDYLVEDALERYVDEAIETDCDVLRFNYCYCRAKDGTKTRGEVFPFFNKKIEESEIKDFILNEMIRGNIKNFIWVLFIKKEILDKLNPFNENIKFMEDKIFYTDLFCKAQSIYLSDIVQYHYYFDESFENKDRRFYEFYISGIYAVFKEIKLICMQNHKLNRKMLNILNTTVYVNINYIIFLLYKTTKDASFIYEFIQQFNKGEFSRIKFKYINSQYVKVCYILSKVNLRLLKIIYDLKIGRGNYEK